MTNFARAVLCLPLLAACASHSTPAGSASDARETNPPCAGFDVAGSDARACAIADQTMEAMGGRAAWDSTRVLCWNFFGRRSHVWDKATGNYRLDEGDKVVLMNLASGTGRVFEKGVEVTDEAARKKALERAHSIWINDSYWLVMPYKLKDSGLTLKWVREAELDGARKADVLQLTFQGVGDTPDNRYEVWIARDTHLVEHWDYFEHRADDKPKMSTPWTRWTRHGRILLAESRGEKREMSNVQVLDTPPASLHQP